VIHHTTEEITMSHSINRVVLVGRLTREPELRALPSGASVCSLRLACNAIKREADGSYGERPAFFDVSVYGAQAESVSRFMSKGRQVAVDGRLDWREWETAEGQRRQAVSVVADTVQFLDAPGERAAEPAEGEDGELAGVAADEDGLVF
jgi:single-strand DNA-binding protein